MNKCQQNSNKPLLKICMSLLSYCVQVWYLKPESISHLIFKLINLLKKSFHINNNIQAWSFCSILSRYNLLATTTNLLKLRTINTMCNTPISYIFMGVIYKSNIRAKCKHILA